MIQNMTLFGSYRVLDLCNETGFLCGKIFADLGADVIKIEKPGGDPARKIGPFYHDTHHAAKSLLWFAYNTGKRSITLDIETSQGQNIFKRLVESADFIFETFPPGYMSSLGLGYKDVSKIKPELIMTSITPFGQTGPYKDFKSSDIILMAMGGAMSLAGDPDRAPLRFSVEQSYTQAGAQAAAATMIAFHYRLSTGEGQHIDVSIQECLCGFGMQVQSWELTKQIVKREGIRITRGQLKPRLIFECKDGYVSWRIYTAALGRGTNEIIDIMREWGEMEPELEGIDFTKIDMNDVDQETCEVWERAFSKFFANHTKAEIFREALKRNIMVFPIANAKDLLNCEQLRAREYWVNVSHPEVKESFVYPGAPFKSNEPSWRINRRAPMIGEHNEEIYLQELGITRQGLNLLMKQRIC